MDASFQKGNQRLNEHFPLTEEEFKKLVNRFKEAYVELKLAPIYQEEDVLHFRKRNLPCKRAIPIDIKTSIGRSYFERKLDT